MNLKYDNCTGLLYVNDVPFTKEAIEACKQVFDYNKNRNNNMNQFSAVIGITDHKTNTTVTLSDEHLKTILAYIKKNNLDLANDKDFYL